MQSIHFSIRPYRSSDNTINPGWIKLCIVDELGTVITSQDICKQAWRDDDHECRAYWMHVLLTTIHKHLYKVSDAKGYIYDKEHAFIIDNATYDEWYRWYYFIDGEDAYAYISRCSTSQHTTNWQARCGVIVGWKFYKELVSHNFREDTAAMLAYARGYLTGMESNAPWDSEGMEALQCLGLSIEGGSDALRAF